MAINTVSQLDKFDNGTQSMPDPITGEMKIGENFRYFDKSYLTEKDIIFADAMDGIGGNSADGYFMPEFHVGRSSNAQVNVSDKYWNSLFEVSKPSSSGKYNQTDNSYAYYSQHTTYEDIIKNVLWDVKTYLNRRNNLDDYNMRAIVEGTQMFLGDKILSGSLSASNCISSTQLTASRLSATEAHAKYTHCLNALCVDCNISATGSRSQIFDGYAIGFVHRGPDNFNNYASGYIETNDPLMQRGTYNSERNNDGWYLSITTSGEDTLSAKPYRTGDPVMIKDGIPYELTAVNFAVNAYNLVDYGTGNGWSVGKGSIISVIDGITADNSTTSTYKAVFFENGIPKATNVIDFAEHAKWSDLGERYIADKPYEPGTLVKFGGEKEITIADDEVNAIVSTKAFDLNACLAGGTTIALCGRVPTKVIGAIRKHEKIMLSTTPGVACKWDGTRQAIGVALENNSNESIKLVECVTRMLF